MNKPLFIIPVILLASCNGITDGDEKTPPIGTFKAIVEGELQKENGDAVGNADVKVVSHEAGCDDEAVSQGVVRTTPGGRFSKQIVDVVAKTVRCVTLDISANSNTAMPDTSISYDMELKLTENEPFEEKVVTIIY